MYTGVWGEAPIGFPEGEKPTALGAEAVSAIGWANKGQFLYQKNNIFKMIFIDKTLRILYNEVWMPVFKI